NMWRSYTQTVDVKYEYSNGEIWAMGGTSIAHNIIAGNIIRAVRAHLRATPRIPFMETIKYIDMRKIITIC
ncbi:Uma2 family endonuclease, partial [Kingella kingae]|uniref:Uma2 family endonuclease n=1 Tax=Kingella kingae TaxID=504 RepID=UPI0020A7FD41